MSSKKEEKISSTYSSSTNSSSYLSETIDDILTSLSTLKTDKNYTEFEFGNSIYPIIQEEEIKFIVVPKGKKFYKYKPEGKFTFPSYYTNKEIATMYMNFYSTKKGSVTTFITKRPAKLFLLNDVDNIIEIARLFMCTPGIKGFLKETRRGALKELFMITGLGSRCLIQKKYQERIDRELSLKFEDYRLHLEVCENVKDEDVKRLTLYAINVQFSRNLNKVLKRLGSDGYVSANIPTATGELAPVVHSDISFCYIANVLKEI